MGAITVKGQVTIPKRIRDALGIGPGDQVEFALLPEGGARMQAVPIQPPFEADWQRFRGIARTGLSTDEIMRMTRGDPAEDPDVTLSEEYLQLLRDAAERAPGPAGWRDHTG